MIKKVCIMLVVLIALICAGIFGYLTWNHQIGNKNENALKKAMVKLEQDNPELAKGKSKEISFNEIIPFSWDKVYTFLPYTTTEYMEEITGIKSKKYSTMMYDEGMQLAFVKDHKVVAFISGKISKLNYEIQFSDCISHEDDAIFLASKENDVVKLTFVCNRNNKEDTEGKKDIKQQFMDNMPGNMYFAEVEGKDGGNYLLLAENVTEENDGTFSANVCDIYLEKDSSINRIDRIQSDCALTCNGSSFGVEIDGESKNYEVDEDMKELKETEEKEKGKTIVFSEQSK